MRFFALRHLVRRLPSLLGLALFGASVWAITRALQQYQIQEIWQSLKATSTQQLLLGLGFTLLNYFVITGYDTLAAQYVRRPLPYAKTAMAATLSTAISNSVGLSLLSGSAIRYRLYSAWGLTATQIAHIIAFCNLSFWLGLLSVSGVVFIAAALTVPTLLHLPFRSVHPLGWLFLSIVIGYLLWNCLSRNALKIGRFEFPHLPIRLACAQIIVAALDWLLAAAVLDALLPAAISYPVFLSVYLLGQISGILSNIPGGLGVFETVLLLSFSSVISPTHLLGTLLLYRVIYYLLPLICAVVLLGVYELQQRYHRV